MDSDILSYDFVTKIRWDKKSIFLELLPGFFVEDVCMEVEKFNFNNFNISPVRCKIIGTVSLTIKESCYTTSDGSR